MTTRADHAPDLAQQRFRQIISDMGAELGHVHGWKRTVAQRLGIAPSHLSRIIAGKRVGVATLHRVADDLSVDPVYFAERADTYREYRHVARVANGASIADETAAMATIAAALERLDGDARDRVIDWLNARYGLGGVWP